jgi:uncharacterized membrane protein YphA (DoxX/SURF4 family)
MLSIFPSLLIFGILAPFVLRVTVGAYFFYTGYKRLGRVDESVTKELEKRLGSLSKTVIIAMGVFETAIGLFLIAGFLTQIMAVLGMIYILKLLWFKNEFPSFIKRERIFYLILFVILLSLLFTGAGALAIDLPL